MLVEGCYFTYTQGCALCFITQGPEALVRLHIMGCAHYVRALLKNNYIPV